LSSGEREILISPTTRVEGATRVRIMLDEFGEVSEAHLEITSLRGFERFLVGAEVEEAPVICNRICGICAVSHHLASVKAVEDALRIAPPETAVKLRRLLHFGQIIQSHATSFFFLTLPDFIYTEKNNKRPRSAFEIYKTDPEIIQRAIELREIGTEISTVLGRRHIQPIAAVPGGMLNPVKDSERQRLLNRAKRGLELSLKALSLGQSLFEEHEDYISRAKVFPANNMALRGEDCLEFYDGEISIKDSQGEDIVRFPPRDFRQNIGEASFEWTLARFPYFKPLGWPAGILRVNSLARINVCEELDTDEAKKAVIDLRNKWGHPLHNNLLSDYARLIELVYASERTIQLLEDETITRENVRIPLTARAGKGAGSVEAPRGTLVHSYEVDKNARLSYVDIVVPTESNNAAINMAIKDVASQCVNAGRIRSDLYQRVETTIRSFDPCISCAHHTIEIVRTDEKTDSDKDTLTA
jgi:F420-non-reducing hydrogenase large subunit